MISQTATFETLEFSKNSICTASKSIVADIKQWEQETMYKILSVKSKSASKKKCIIIWRNHAGFIFIDLSKQVETAHEKIVKCKHIIEENRRKHQEALEDIQDRIFKLVVSWNIQLLYISCVCFVERFGRNWNATKEKSYIVTESGKQS